MPASFGGTPNLHFPHLHQTQIYTNPKFTQDPNLHKPRFTRDPYLHSPDLHKSISAPRFQKTQIYTKPEFTQPNFAQNPKFTQLLTQLIMRGQRCMQDKNQAKLAQTTKDTRAPKDADALAKSC